MTERRLGMSFAKRFQELSVERDTLALAWIGQAGFLLKTDKQTIIAIDPYLTDYVYHCLKGQYGDGFKRVCPPLFQPGELPVDILLISHEHEDHLDIEAMPELLVQSGIQAYMPQPCVQLLKDKRISAEAVRPIRKGEKVELDGFTLYTTDCDHGDSAPFAVGYVLDFSFKKIYYSSDTAYQPKRLMDAVRHRPEVALLPINGSFGNMNGAEAALLSKDLSCEMCIPHHFWTFPAQGGNPAAAIEAFRNINPACCFQLLTPGEIIILRK